MTSTLAVKSEIKRFLKSSDPEVLCITGEWGVGKTCTWQTIFDQLRIKHEIGLWRYSYVSLFGINSLDALKTAFFENMEVIAPQGRAGYEWVISGGNTIFKNSKQLVNAISALPIPYLGGALSKAQPFLFSAVRNQIVCVDDLERRGSGLSVKDVFGLISYLREQRGCKIALLLNQTQLDQDGTSKREFADYFEKVIDTKLVFAPTSSEAISIAIEEEDEISTLIREHCEKLAISNIRVIKKIQRLIELLDPIIGKFDNDTARQFVHSTAMFGWSKLDAGAKPPSLGYLKRSHLGRLLERRLDKDAQGKLSEDEQRWDVILGQYGWGDIDDLDFALMNFVETSILDADDIENSAKTVEERRRQLHQVGSFEQAWRLFHDSFNDNENEACEKLVEGVQKHFAVVSKANLDETVSVLKELGRTGEAGALIDFAKEHGGDSFWSQDDPFNRAIRDPRIQHIIEERKQATKPVFDFQNDLLSAAQNRNIEKLALLAAVPVEQYQSLFESTSGEDLRRYIYAALEYRKISNADDDERKIVSNAEEALRRIGRKSKLNEMRVRKYGISLGTDEEVGSKGA